MPINKKSIIVLLLSVVLFISFLILGLKISSLRGLWNDEIFSQRHSIQSRTYLQIIQGRAPEGNNFPLFYLIQKAVTQLFKFELPKEWEGVGYGYHSDGQRILRLQSNVWISLTLVLIFWFFSYYFSYIWGVFTTLLFLSSDIIWVYWAEARPYGLWIFLTIVQCLIIFRICRLKVVTKKWWLILGISQTLLSLTAVFAVIQSIIGAVCVCLLRKTDKKILVYQLMHLIVLGIFYYSRALHYETWFSANPLEIFYAVISKDMLLIFLLYVGVFVYLHFRQGKNIGGMSQGFEHAEFILFSLFILIFGFSLIGFFILKDHGGPKGFTVISRHFVFLIPPIFMGLSLCAIDLFQAFKKNLWMRFNLAFIFIFILVQRFLENSFIYFSIINLYLNS